MRRPGTEVENRDIEHAVDQAPESHCLVARNLEKTACNRRIEILVEQRFEIPANRRQRRAKFMADPIEYQHRWLRSVVTQYQVGRDVSSFADGVRGALRADPDVLFIGELRGVETVSACLQAAETGHLVFAALHTPSETPQAINRIIGLFPSEEQGNARTRLADALRAVVGLRLLPLRDNSGLRAAAEVMVANDAIRRLIRDGATHQLRGVITSSRREGMQTLEAHLGDLVSTGDIDIAAARSASLYAEEIKESPIPAFRRR